MTNASNANWQLGLRGKRRLLVSSPPRTLIPIGKVSGNSLKLGTATEGHPLEGEIFVEDIYAYVCKKNFSRTSCPGTLIPETIIFKDGHPKAWYRVSTNGGVVSRSAGHLRLKEILKCFKESCQSTSDICAQLYTVQANAVSHVEELEISYLTIKGVESLLNSGTIPNATLQMFVSPNTSGNHEIQATWNGEGIKSTIMRVNNYGVMEIQLHPTLRGPTFSGGQMHSQEVKSEPQVARLIPRLCKQFVDHFKSTEGQSIRELVCYFKVDRSGVPWLLWCSRVRIGLGEVTHYFRPVGLRPREPLIGANDGMSEELKDLLQRTDKGQAQLRLVPVALSKTFPITPSPAKMSLHLPKFMTMPIEPPSSSPAQGNMTPSFSQTPKISVNVSNSSKSFGNESNLSLKSIESPGRTGAFGMLAALKASSRMLSVLKGSRSRRASHEKSGVFGRRKSEDVIANKEAKEFRRRQAGSLINDLIYEMTCHFQNESSIDPRPFLVRGYVIENLETYLSSHEIDLVMHTIQLYPTSTSNSAVDAIFGKYKEYAEDWHPPYMATESTLMYHGLLRKAEDVLNRIINKNDEESEEEEDDDDED